jgi:hypothetical protein
MPAYRDRDTLVLRAPDRRPVAEAAKLIDRELDRRPAPTLADVRLAPKDRALAMFQANYPALAERAGLAVLGPRPRASHPGGPATASSLWLGHGPRLRPPSRAGDPAP